MKHWLILYNIYFVLLMITPRNHTMLHSDLMHNLLGSHFNIDNKCNHSHHELEHHHEKSAEDCSQPSCPCNPSCSCNVTNFAIDIPPFDFIFEDSNNQLAQEIIIPTNVWIPTSNQYTHLMTNEIWHPPKQV